MTPERSPFLLDLRAVGLFRGLLALTILWDQGIRLESWLAFHSTAGLVSLADSRAWDGIGAWSIYWMSESPLLPVLLEALRLLATLTLLAGIRSRLSAFVLFMLLASAAVRNPLLLQGGDGVLVAMTFFALFLPLGERGSLERLWFGPGTRSVRYRSAATVAYSVQVLLVWFMSGILKTGEQWWGSGTAISMALHLEAFVSEFARLWRGWDWLVQPLTWFVFWLECLAPWLALAPDWRLRTAGLLALVVLEIGIWLSLEVGLFPFISLVSLVPLFPPPLVDVVARWREHRASRKGSDLVLFYDRDCRFCAFACRLLLAAGGVRGAAVREAQSDPIAAAILDEHFSWSVARLRGSAGTDPAAGPHANYRRGWAAVRFVLERSPRSWLLRLVPGPARGGRTYAWIARNRGAIGSAGGICFGRSGAGSRHGPAGRFVVSFALIAVLAWNVVSYPAVQDRKDLRPFVKPLVSLFAIKQYWGMFAPYPYASDYWHVMPGLTRDGRRLDVLSGRPIRLDPPRDGPDRYGGYRWRKVVFRSLRRGETERLLDYFCRTGKWSALDLWEFHRPNLGTSETASLPYEVTRMAWATCMDSDGAAVTAFFSDIGATMEEYRDFRPKGG